eukprot:25064_1
MDGIQQTIDLINEYGATKNPIYIMSLAPLTNIAYILDKYPLLRNKMRIFSSGGSIYKGYPTGETPTTFPKSSEMNIVTNTSASIIVYGTEYVNKMCAAPLDTTNFIRIQGKNYQNLLIANKTHNNLLVNVLLSNYVSWYENGGYDFYGYGSWFNPIYVTPEMYDVEPVFMASIVAENSYDKKQDNIQMECNLPQLNEYMNIEKLKIRVNESGFTIITNMIDAQYIYEAIDWNNGASFDKYVTDSIINYYKETSKDKGRNNKVEASKSGVDAMGLDKLMMSSQPRRWKIFPW